MSNPHPKSKVQSQGKTRVNLRITADLEAWVKEYAERENTTMTRVIVECLVELRRKTEEYRVEQF